MLESHALVHIDKINMTIVILIKQIKKNYQGFGIRFRRLTTVNL
ncbi:MAG: hypothetical protein Q8936_23470 [Bacillota bacterium]|nr:hypothetical protein [Bacillota bacterium]